MPEGKGCSGWISLGDLFSQLDDARVMKANRGGVHIYVENPSKPHWVRLPERRPWNNVIVCDVGGINVPWKSVGIMVNQCFCNKVILDFPFCLLLYHQIVLFLQWFSRKKLDSFYWAYKGWKRDFGFPTMVVGINPDSP